MGGDVSIRFSPTPIATTTAPDGAAATVWNVRAHEYASINGHTTSIVQNQKFLESHNYFAAHDNSGAQIECHFAHIGAPATCVNKQPKHHHTYTSTFKHAKAFATAYHKHVVKAKSQNATSSATQASSSQATLTAAAVAAAVTTTSVQGDGTQGDGTVDQSPVVGSTAGSGTKQNATSAAAKAKSLPVLLVTASVLFSAVLALQP